MHRLPRTAAAIVVLGAALLAACSGDSPAPTAPITGHTVDRVVLVSVDGLRGDALRLMPNLWALARQGAWTDSATTIVPSLTLPAHLAMLTGRDVSTFGITTNGLSQQSAMALISNGATTIFSWADVAGGSSAAVVGASLVPAGQREDVRNLLGLGELAVSDLDASHVADAALPLLAVPGGPKAPRVVFVHLSDVDLAGHASGWVDAGGALGAEYVSAAGRVDDAIGRLHDAVAAEVAAGRTLLVVTADHGGGAGVGCTPGVDPTHEHCTASPADVTIPMVLVGSVPAERLAGHPRLTQLARTLGGALGLTVPAAADDALTP